MYKYKSLQGEIPYGLISRSCFYSPNLITVDPLEPDIRDLSKSHNYEVMTSLLLEGKYPIEPFKWGLPALQIWMFLASQWLET